MTSSLLVIDIGNTHTVVGFYRGDDLSATLRLSTKLYRTADELLFRFRQCLEEIGESGDSVTGVVVSSVVPVLDEMVRSALTRLTGKSVLMVTPEVDLGLTVDYDRPGDIGADRLVNAVAAVHHFGAPVIVIDFGTATTFCVVDRSKTYCGGAIAVGVRLSLETLTAKAARLHSVDLKLPQRVLGKSTDESIRSGILYGFASLTDGMVERLYREIDQTDTVGTTCPVVATGGLASLMAPICRRITAVRDDLTLEGLRLIYRMNRP